MVIAENIRVGMKLSHPEHGTFIVSRYRWHYRQGVEIFDQDNERVGLVGWKEQFALV